MFLSIASGDKQRLFEALEKDFDRYEKVAREVLAGDDFKIDGKAYSPDQTDEILCALARISPSTFVTAAMKIAIGDNDGARSEVVAAMSTFKASHPEWFMWTPSRAYYLILAGDHSASRRAEADRIPESERRRNGRVWARARLDQGKPIPADTTGGYTGPVWTPEAEAAEGASVRASRTADREFTQRSAPIDGGPHHPRRSPGA